MDDSDSELLSDSEEIDIVAQANKARAAAAAQKVEDPAPEEKKEEEEVIAAEEDEADAAAEAAAAAAAEEAAKQEEAARLAAEEEAAKKAAEEEAARKAEEEEAARLEAEEAARKAAEEEAAKKAAEEEAARKAAEEEAARKAAEEEAARLEAIRQKEEEERKQKEEEAAAVEEEDDEEEEEEEDEDEEEEVEGEEEVEAMVEKPVSRSRATSTYHDQHLLKLKEQEEKDRIARLEAQQGREGMAHFSSMSNVFKSEAQKREEAEKLRLLEEHRKKALEKADVKNEVIDGERRITELKLAQKKGKKKKAWKPLKEGFVHIINSSFTMKKGKKHSIIKEDGYYLCLQLLPVTCNIDETEAEWTKNKKNDNLVPALVAFSTKERYDDFAKTVKGKNMKAASGLMALAKYATGLCHFRDLYALGPDIATAIANLKMNHIKSEAVLKVDSYRGGDSGEDNQFVVVDRSQAFILVVEEDEELEEWKRILKENQPAE